MFRIVSLAFPFTAAPWHFLYFLPLPHGHGSLRPTFGLVALHLLDDVVAAGAAAASGRCRAPGVGLTAHRWRRTVTTARRDGELSVICGGRRAAGGRTGGAAAASSLVAGDRRQPPQVPDDLFLDRGPSSPERARSSLSCIDERVALARSRAGRCLPSGGRGCRGDPSTARRRSGHDVALDTPEDFDRDQPLPCPRSSARTSAQSSSLIASAESDSSSIGSSSPGSTP